MRSRQHIAHLNAPECRATIIREAQALTALSRSSVVKSAARSSSAASADRVMMILSAASRTTTPSPGTASVEDASSINTGP
jgi:hypothetical protein